MDSSDEDYRGDDEDASSLCSTSIMDEDEETDDWSGDGTHPSLEKGSQGELKWLDH
jgi:hypothetical protein